jgi:hypothetical protein
MRSIPTRPVRQPRRQAEGLARATRELVGEDGMLLVELWWEIASDPMRKDSDRIRASELLAECGWGKAAVFAPQEGDPLNLAHVRRAAEEFRTTDPLGTSGLTRRLGATSMALAPVLHRLELCAQRQRVESTASLFPAGRYLLTALCGPADARTLTIQSDAEAIRIRGTRMRNLGSSSARPCQKRPLAR